MSKKTYFCKSKAKNKYGVYDKYYLISITDFDGQLDVYRFNNEEVREMLRKNPDSIINLKLTSDNRIIDRNDYKKTIRKVSYFSGNDKLKVKDLVPGYIVNQNVHVKIKDKLYREVIVGVGYILNDNKIQLIKNCYSDDEEIVVMTPIQVRNRIVVDKDLRQRLAVFYATQMRHARYVHVSKIKDEESRRYLLEIKHHLMTAEFLEKDINLLFMLFILYGYHMYTFEHSVDVAIYACLLGRKTIKNFNTEDCIDLFMAGLLHDLGKLTIDVETLDQASQLEPDQRKKMNEHANKSAEIIEELCNCESNIFIWYKNNKNRRNKLINCAKYHHTLYKNTPNDNNKIYYDIIEVADIIDAIISPRPYRARRNVVPTEGQREYMGLEQAFAVLNEAIKIEKVSKVTVNGLRKIFYVDSKYDTDDAYGKKIRNIKFNEDILYNYEDLTKHPKYID